MAGLCEIHPYPLTSEHRGNSWHPPCPDCQVFFPDRQVLLGGTKAILRGCIRTSYILDYLRPNLRAENQISKGSNGQFCISPYPEKLLQEDNRLGNVLLIQCQP